MLAGLGRFWIGFRSPWEVLDRLWKVLESLARFLEGFGRFWIGFVRLRNVLGGFV